MATTAFMAEAKDFPNTSLSGGLLGQPPPNSPTIFHHNDIGKLVEALAAAQLEFLPLSKTKLNPYYGSMYADLQDVIAATQPALAKHGLAIIQLPETNIADKTITLVSRLSHKSGQYIENRLTLMGTMKAKDGNLKFDQQSCIAATTYARRLSWQSLVGVAGENDDDGNSLGTEQPDKPAKKPKYEPKPGKVDSVNVEHKEQEYHFTPEGPKAVQKLDSGVPRAVIPPSVEVAPLSPLDLPSREELKGFVSRARKFTGEILPKLDVTNPAESLKAYFEKKTGKTDTKLLTKTEWSDILSGLDSAYADGKLKETLG